MNSFVAYPAQSLVGSAILVAALVVFLALFGLRPPETRVSGSDEDACRR